MNGHIIDNAGFPVLAKRRIRGDMALSEARSVLAAMLSYLSCGLVKFERA
jgi:hypothetical protein